MTLPWKAIFVGDIFINQSPLRGLLAEDLKSIIRNHDIISCNFEAPLSAPPLIPFPKAGPHLAQCEDAANIALNAGFNLFSLANNHIADYGAHALRVTIDALKPKTVLGAGMSFDECYLGKIIPIKGTKVGFMSFAEWGFGALTEEGGECAGFAWINHPSVNQRIINFREQVDVLIIQAHAGAEEVVLPLPEWRCRYRELIALGVDVLIGHHPHVPQGWERYQDKHIFYSLGNFSFDMDGADNSWNRGYAVSLSFKGAHLDQFEIIPIEKNTNGVKICHDAGYRQELADLTTILASSDYPLLADQQALCLWRERYLHYYQDALQGITPGAGAYRVAKMLARRLCGKSKVDPLLLLHNLKIETHRYCVERAMTLMGTQ